MPLMSEEQDRPDCLPSTKQDCMLPSINFNSKSGTKNIRYMKTRSVEEKIRADSPKLAHSSAPGSEVSTPFRLPSIDIDRSKSNSVSSLTTDHFKSRGRSKDRRATLCRSPSCPVMGYWYDQQVQDANETSKQSGQEHNLSTHRLSFSLQEDTNTFKLPNIEQRNKSYSNAKCIGTSPIQTKHSDQTRRQSMSLKRDLSILNTPRREEIHSPDRLSSYSTPRQNLDRNGSHNENQAVLLPISTELRIKAKRKRKKIPDSVINADYNDDTEKMLREKLEAIERRDSRLIHDEDETTTIIDMMNGESVKNNISNAKKDSLKSTPSLGLYQNTSRIKTEKKITTVKAS